MTNLRPPPSAWLALAGGMLSSLLCGAAMWLDADRSLAYAVASQRIEGLCMPPYAIEMTRRMLLGEIIYWEARDLLIAEARGRAEGGGAW